MFYKKVNKKSDKEMFEFLKNHFRYSTLNYWNNLYSIANNVKVYKIGLDYEILDLLNVDDYFTINTCIEDWELEHNGYSVGFNGRSGGYLVLYNKDNNKSVLDDEIEDNSTYEDFKDDIKFNYDYMKNYHDRLVEQVELVQDFDKLCDDLIEECKYMLDHYKIEDEEYSVIKTRRVLVEK